MNKVILFCCLCLLAASCSERGQVQNTQPAQEQRIIQNETKSNVSAMPHPISLPALMQKEFDGRDLVLVKILESNSVYTRHYVTYKSLPTGQAGGSLTISGIMNIPKGTPPEGGWPVLFLNHGHIDTSIYTNGRGLKREQDYFARHGFAVLHSDYRNHAESSKDPEAENNFRLGYTEDVINAVLAVQSSNLLELSKTKFGMLGHSMGGGITQNVLVVRPELVKAAVLYAPVSPRLSDNFERWTLGTRKVSEGIMEKYPSPGESVCKSLITGVAEKSNDEAYIKNVALWCQGPHDENFWSNLSAEKFFEKITAPVLYFHGDADDSVPVGWSRSTVTALKNLNKQAELVEFKGQPHEFTPPDWNRFMERSVEFFKNNL